MDTKEAGLQKEFQTIAIHAGQEPEKWKHCSVVTPIITATTFKQASPYDGRPEFVYARDGNPTRASLETLLASIEGARFAYVFASGMGAVNAIVSLLSCGDHLLTSGDIYGGTISLLSNIFTRMGIEVTKVDFTDLSSVKQGMQKNTKMVWLETPTNPLLKVVDIAAVVAIARTQPGVIVAIDNTFLTPYFQKPLQLGVDIAMCSLTKYMNGHSDVIMGSAVTNDPELAQRLHYLQETAGSVPSPFDCFLVTRSLKTLAVRMDRHRSNARAVAEWLAQQPCVLQVMHPELASHPQYQITLKQTSGHSGVFSFRHAGGKSETAILLSSLKVFAPAESLGGCESLAALPCIMSHGTLPQKEKEALGITDSLVRLSVGLEDVKDLIADLKQALNKAFSQSV